MSSDSDLIMTSTGTPFADEGSAKRAMKAKGISGTIVPCEGGFAISTAKGSKTSTPPPAFDAGKDVDETESLPEDLKRFREPDGETYHRVKLPPKRDKNDENFILGSVNGESYNFLREVEIVVPGRFIKAWGLTVKNVYSKDPGKERTLAGRVAYCTTNVIGMATKREWLEFRRSCLEKRQRELGQYHLANSQAAAGN